MIKIIVIGDQIMLRDMIEDTLIQTNEFEIIDHSDDASKIVSLCDKNLPDIIVMDVCTANHANGIKYAGLVKQKYPNVKIIAMTGVPELSYIENARKNKIDSFVYKNISKNSLIDAIKKTYENYSIYPNTMINDNHSTILDNLSSREFEILNLYCNGMDREAISEHLNISINTLKKYIKSLLEKTNYPSLSRLAIYCISNQYIIPEDSI